MIVLFQLILYSGQRIWHNFVTKFITKIECNEIKHGIDNNPAVEDPELGLRFRPPLYVQRYTAVRDVIENNNLTGKIKKIVDFGCAELSFFQYVKKIPGVTEILEVDIVRDLLDDNKFKVKPLIYEYLNRRPEPLHVSVLAGSIDDPDLKLKGTDMVACIEIIEHLYPDTLEGVPYNIFGFIKPRIAVFTTPNVEYNVLFPDCTSRHLDHKFEWSRLQFQDWAVNITARFPDYSVSFDGVGGVPKDCTLDLGCCSQIAIFIANEENPTTEIPQEANSWGICRYCSENQRLLPESGFYETVYEIEYPYEEVVEESIPVQVFNEVTYQINKFGEEYGDYYNYDTWRTEIPLSFLYTFVEELCSWEEFEKILEEKYQIEECLYNEETQKCLIRKYENSIDDSSEFDEGDLKTIQDLDNNSEKSLNDDWDNFETIQNSQIHLDQRVGENVKILENSKTQGMISEKDQPEPSQNLSEPNISQNPSHCDSNEVIECDSTTDWPDQWTDITNTSNSTLNDVVIPVLNPTAVNRVDVVQDDDSEAQSSSSLEVNISNVDVEFPRIFNVPNISTDPFPGWLVRMFDHDDYLSRGDNLNVNPQDDLNENASVSTLEADDEDDVGVNRIGIELTTVSRNESRIVDSLDDSFYDPEPITSTATVWPITTASSTVDNPDTESLDSST